MELPAQKRSTPGYQDKQLKILSRPSDSEKDASGFLNMVSNLFNSTAKPDTWRATHLETIAGAQQSSSLKPTTK